MLKTQKLTHDMMVALDLALPNEAGPSLEGVQKINFKLLRDLVYEEAVISLGRENPPPLGGWDESPPLCP